jgi:hypothetical protein
LISDVVVSGVEDEDYKPKVVYEYQIMSQKYTGERITFGGLPTTRMGAAKVVQQYPAGAQVTVYYDPGSPTQAVLEPGTGSGLWVGIIFSASLFIFGLLKILGLV